jgi:hypothetical protein
MAFVAVLLLGALLLKSRRGGGSMLRARCCLFKVRKLVGEEGSCKRVRFAFWMLADDCDER